MKMAGKVDPDEECPPNNDVHDKGFNDAMNIMINIVLWLVIGLLLIALFNLFQGASKNNSSVNLPFSDFIAEVEAGNISSVNIKGNSVEGYFEDGRAFSTYSPNDPNLIEKLTNKGVSIMTEAASVKGDVAKDTNTDSNSNILNTRSAWIHTINKSNG